MSDAQFKRQVAQQFARLEKEIRDLRRAARLGNSSIENGSIGEFDEDGNLVGIIGTQPDGSHIYKTIDGPTPLQPTDPVCTVTPLTSIVTWNGNLISAFGEVDAELSTYDDFENCEVHIGTTESFLYGPETHVGNLPRAGGTTSVAAPAGISWIRLVIRSKAGKYGPPSPAVSVDVPNLVDPTQFDQLEDDLAQLVIDLGTAQDMLDAAFPSGPFDVENALSAVMSGYTIEYAGSESDTVPPTTGWSATPPTGFTYMWQRVVITYADNSTTASTPVLLTGQAGQPGSPGIGVVSITPYFQRLAAGSPVPALPTVSPPPTPWTTTEPTYQANTVLYRTERILYTDGTFQYTAVTKVASYEGIDAAMVSANGKNIVTYTNIANKTDTMTFPGVTGRRVGDIHRFRWTTNGEILKEGILNASNTWEEIKFGDMILTSLDVGKLTAGTAAIDTAVIQKLVVAIATVIELNADRIVAGTISVDRLDGQLIAALVGEFLEISANQITAGTIDVLLSLATVGGKIIAGDANGTAAELSGANGLRFWQAALEANATRRLSGQLGGPGGDALTLWRSDGRESVHLSAEDGLSTEMLMVGGDPVFYGRYLLGTLADAAGSSDAWLLDMPQGAISSGSLQGGRTTPVGEAMGYGDISFETQNGRTYMIVQTPGPWSVASASSGSRVDMIHRWTWDGSQPSLSSTIRGYLHTPAPNNGFLGLNWVMTHDCSATTNISNNSDTFHLPPGLLRMLTQVSAINCSITSGSNALSAHLRVYDMGRTASSTTNDNDGGATQVTPQTVYRSYWESNSHRTWNNLGQETYPPSAALLSHGIYPWNTGLGQRTSVALFTAANSKKATGTQPGHTNISINSALNGRTLLKAWVQLWCTETGQSGGANLQLSQYAGTSLPSTNPPTAPTVENAVRAGSWVTVVVPTSWFNTTSERGIKTATTSGAYADFARYAGSTDTSGHKPRLILEYQ